MLPVFFPNYRTITDEKNLHFDLREVRDNNSNAAPRIHGYFAGYTYYLVFILVFRQGANIAPDATKTEIQEIKRENARLKTLVAELSLQMHVLKKTAASDLV